MTVPFTLRDDAPAMRGYVTRYATKMALAAAGAALVFVLWLLAVAPALAIPEDEAMIVGASAYIAFGVVLGMLVLRLNLRVRKLRAAAAPERDADAAEACRPRG